MQPETSLKDEMRHMLSAVTAAFPIPEIAAVFLPPFYMGGQPKDAEFMALALSGGAVGVSYVLLPDEKGQAYNALTPADFVGRDPRPFALAFGSADPIENMISLAALNAICQHIIKQTDFPLDAAADSLGLLEITRGDRVGMVGFFYPLIHAVEKAQAELVIVERNKDYIRQFPDLHITLNAAELQTCNKVLCTSTTVFNNTLDDILENCASDARISVIGPTAGYFPDPLFSRGVDVVGGTFIKDGELFMQLIAEGKRWGPATQKFCFQKSTYPGLPKGSPDRSR